MSTQKFRFFVVCNNRSLFDCEINKLNRDVLLKVGYRDQINPNGSVYRLTNKRYIRDNRLILLDSPYI